MYFSTWSSIHSGSSSSPTAAQNDSTADATFASQFPPQRPTAAHAIFFFFLHKIFVLCAFDAIRRISNSNGALWPLHKRQKGEEETTGDMMRPRISVSSGEITRRLPRQKENKSSKSRKSAEEYRTGTAVEIYVIITSATDPGIDDYSSLLCVPFPPSKKRRAERPHRQTLFISNGWLLPNNVMRSI